MFCYQCEQSQKGNCHTAIGVCGKDETTAAFQDLLVEVSKGISVMAHLLRQEDHIDSELDRFVMEALFTTVTNVNFDKDDILKMIKRGYDLKESAKTKYQEITGKTLEDAGVNGATKFEYSNDISILYKKWGQIGIEQRQDKEGKLKVGLEELIMYGLKGTIAYADHAYVLGIINDEVFARMHETLYFLDQDHSIEELLTKAMETGELNLKVMELLDFSHTDTYGHPVPTPVNINPIEGKAILVSGHDLKDLEELLKQTDGLGINIYTHGEMLPAHGYPELKKYKHLAGNYGGAWQDQHKEFDEFPGAILMTTNCIQKPRDTYMSRIFTCGLVQWPEVEHIDDRDFSPVINAAMNAEGFKESLPAKTILTGFGHNAVLNVADKVVDAVKAGKIRHFYLIGGCDGAKSGRNYYTEFAQKAPKDSIILTLACGKFRFNKMDFGDIEGIPRLLDVGQCNDAYSAIKIASALAEAFGTDVNSLPLSLILSWYEQKAVAILLSLLHLGIKNIRIGPSLPKFIEPEALDLLVKDFNLMPISEDAETDIAATLA